MRISEKQLFCGVFFLFFLFCFFLFFFFFFFGGGGGEALFGISGNSSYKGLKVSLIIMPTWDINSFVRLKTKGQRAKKAPFWNGHTDYKINTKTCDRNQVWKIFESLPRLRILM